MQHRIVGKKIEHQIVCNIKTKSNDLLNKKQIHHQQLFTFNTHSAHTRDHEKKRSTSSHKDRNSHDKKNQQRKIKIGDILKQRIDQNNTQKESLRKPFLIPQIQEKEEMSILQQDKQIKQKLQEDVEFIDCQPNYQLEKEQPQEQKDKVPVPYRQSQTNHQIKVIKQKKHQPQIRREVHKDKRKQACKKMKSQQKFNVRDTNEKKKQKIQSKQKKKQKEKHKKKQQAKIQMPKAVSHSKPQKVVRQQPKKVIQQCISQQKVDIIDTSMQFAQIQKCIQQQVQRAWQVQPYNQKNQIQSQQISRDLEYKQNNAIFNYQEYKNDSELIGKEQANQIKKAQVQKKVDNIDIDQMELVNINLKKERDNKIKHHKISEVLRQSKKSNARSSSDKKSFSNQKSKTSSKKHKKNQKNSAFEHRQVNLQSKKDRKPPRIKAQLKQKKLQRPHQKEVRSQKQRKPPLQNQALKRIPKQKYLTESSQGQNEFDLSNMLNSDVFKMQVDQLLKKQRLLI